MSSSQSIYGFLSVCVCLYAAVWATRGQSQHPLANHGKPNIVMVLTDDQDLHMDSLEYMPRTRELVAEQGTSFANHFCTNALCCPSRVTLWTGKAPHNTNVTDVNPPHGGYPKFISQGFNDNYLPLWLQGAGYNTYYVGKLFNAQKVTNYDKPHAAGWTGSDFLLDPFTYEYRNATFQRNHDPPVSHEGEYSTDVVASKSYGFLDDAVAARKPFMLTVAPVAPHSNVHIIDKNIHGNYSGASAVQSPPVPADRHKSPFQDARVPRTPAFNPDSPNGAAWISQLTKQNKTNVEYNDEWYRNRLRSLQAVDEMVAELIDRLDTHGILEDTYFIFTTDNGYHVGQHRLQPGKQCAYKEDINIPFMIRGPGIRKNHTSHAVTSHTDLAATFLEIAGASKRSDLDGEAMPLAIDDNLEVQSHHRQEHVNVEMWGIIMSEGKYGADLHHNHTYKALRVIGEGYSLRYTVWCNGEHELYDLKNDPYELDNIYTQKQDAILSFAASEPGPLNPDTKGNEDASTSVASLVSRLDALLVVLKTCKARECSHPWETIHPQGDVRCLRDALDSSYDAFYAAQQKLYWTQCEQAYVAESEGPDGVDAFMWHEVSV